MNTNKIQKTKDKRPGWVRTLTVAAVSILVGAIIFIAVGAYIYSITPHGKYAGLYDSIKFIIKPGQTAFNGKKTMNILCVGLDHNYTDKGIMYTKVARTDTIFVISIDDEAKRLNMLSIPRDAWVEIPGYGYGKINSAYSIGGMDLTRKTVSKFLGININNYIIIRIKAANEIVDALGGLEIDVPKDMNYDDNWGNLHIHLKQGVQKLNGTEAAGFARFRHDEEGDWGRMKRQQQVINALIRELKKPENILKIDKLIKIAHDNIETDLTSAEMLDICRLYKDFDRKNMKTGIIKGDDAMSADEQAIIIPYESEKVKLVKSLIIRDEALENTCRVTVLNGSSTDGLATEMSEILKNEGYTVENIGDADRYDYEESVIIPHKTGQASAKQLANYLGYVKVHPVEESSGDEDYTIIIGNKWLEWKRLHPEIFPEIRDNARTEAPVHYPGVNYSQYSRDDYGETRRDAAADPPKTEDKQSADDEKQQDQNQEQRPDQPAVADPTPADQPTERIKAIPIPVPDPQEGRKEAIEIPAANPDPGQTEPQQTEQPPQQPEDPPQQTEQPTAPPEPPASDHQETM